MTSSQEDCHHEAAAAATADVG